MTSLAEEVDVVIGVDTHKYTHTAAVVVARTAAVVTKVTVAADPVGYEELYRLGGHGGRRAWSLEGTASYGAGLSRFLQERGERVVEIDHPQRPRRRDGVKSDEVDAVRAAREALGRDKLAEPRGPGRRACLAALLCTRASAVEAAKQARTQLQSLLVTGPEPLRAQLGRRRGMALLRAAAVVVAEGEDLELQVTGEALRRLAQRALALYQEAKAHEAAIKAMVRAWHPELLDERGVGPIVAASVLCAWSHPGRLRGEASFATLAGVAPIDASSGMSPRRRLSRRGDRHLNSALHVVAVVRWRHDPATIAYCQRRRAEGKSDREIKRCLKRYIARSLFRLLESSSKSGNDSLDKT